jgi:hypothetical protein
MRCKSGKKKKEEKTRKMMKTKESVGELNVYVSESKRVYGLFSYAPLDDDN